MKIMLAGPVDTAALGRALERDLSALPAGFGYSPLVQLAAGLVRMGHDLHVLTLDPTIDTPSDHIFDGLRITFCPLRGPPRYQARARSKDLFALEIASLEQVMRQADCDIIHAHWTYEFAEAAVRSRRPHLVTMHDLGWDCLVQFRDPYRLMRLAMAYRTVPRIRHLSAVSPHVAARAWHYGFFGQVPVVPNPIAAAAPRSDQVAQPVLVAVGSDSRLKNIGAAVTAMQIVRRTLPEVELHLFGPGLDSTGRYGKVDKSVICHGQVPHDQLMQFLEQHAALLIHPSRTETFGLILAEAKMRGVPVVAGHGSGGVPYVVGQAGGLLVDIESPPAIARAILDLMTDRAAYARASRSGHADAVARFGLDQVCARYVGLYAGILRQDRGR